MKFITIVLIAVVLVGLAVFGLAIQVVFKKGHKFPDTHVGHNKNMKKMGITCATSMDKIEQAKAREELRFKKMTLSK